MLCIFQESQFNQNLDSLEVSENFDSTSVALNISGVFYSHYKDDTRVFNSNSDYNITIDATKTMQTKSPGLLVNANSQTPGASNSLILR